MQVHRQGGNAGLGLPEERLSEVGKPGIPAQGQQPCPPEPGRGRGPSTRSYLQCEVEATAEVGRDIKVGAQRLQNGPQEQLPEGLQHPAGTQTVTGPRSALLHPGKAIPVQVLLHQQGFQQGQLLIQVFHEWGHSLWGGSSGSGCTWSHHVHTSHQAEPQLAKHSPHRSGWSQVRG